MRALAPRGYRRDVLRREDGRTDGRTAAPDSDAEEQVWSERGVFPSAFPWLSGCTRTDALGQPRCGTGSRLGRSARSSPRFLRSCSSPACLCSVNQVKYVNRREAARRKRRDSRAAVFEHDTTHRQRNGGWRLISRGTVTRVPHARVGSDHAAV